MCISGRGSLWRCKKDRGIFRKSGAYHVSDLYVDGYWNRGDLLQKYSRSDRDDHFLCFWAECCVWRDPGICYCMGCKKRRLFHRSRTGIRRYRFCGSRGQPSGKTGISPGPVCIYRFFCGLYIYGSDTAAE